MAKNTDKSYTKKDKLGVSYTTCVGKGGKQLRGTKTKDTKQYKKVLKATKKVEKEEKDKDIKSYKNVLKATKKFEKDQDKSDMMMYKKMMKKMKDPKVMKSVSETMSAQNSLSSYGGSASFSRPVVDNPREPYNLYRFTSWGGGRRQPPKPPSVGGGPKYGKPIGEGKYGFADIPVFNAQGAEHRRQHNLQLRRAYDKKSLTGNKQFDSLLDYEQQELLDELM